MECFKHLYGPNPHVNGVIVDQASGIYTLIRKINLQVARLICKVLSDEELKWSCSGSLREVKITKSELMKDPSRWSKPAPCTAISAKVHGKKEVESVFFQLESSKPLARKCKVLPMRAPIL